MLKIKTKKFNELSISELYEILQLRSEVFVVEQDCVYQDLDGKDKCALHVFGTKNNKIVAYTRVFKPGDYFKEASIGRVVVALKERHHKYGNIIMEASIKVIQGFNKKMVIKISAQSHLKLFYNNLGFIEEGEEYLEDEIPHIIMLLK